ncbi:MAG: ABC transporter permease [Acidimicrobiia bacterium]|nr:ABC transporter permease [Acidimicrobiia bacterium]MCL4292759.1 ABC transporter permease [Acidimicrobiia bacterium]
MRRDQVTAALSPVLVNLGALLLTVAISMGVIAVSGNDPVAAMRALWDGAFGGRTQIAGTLSKMIPLMLVALGWIVAYRARRVSIGFEGQILAGGILATWVGLSFSSLPMVIHLPLAVLAGVVGGALWAGIAAVLWARRSVNEIISTLLLNLIAIQIVNWLVRGPFQESTGTFPRSGPIAPSARWPELIEHTPLSWDFPLALATVFGIWFVLKRTTFGFRLQFTGANEEAARYGGIDTRSVTVIALVVSGALAGLAGSSLLLGGESRSMSDNFSANYGFEGIVVALLARNHPIACIPAALLFALLRQGGGLMEARVGVPSSVVMITQGLVILLVAGSGFLLDQRGRVRVDAEESTPHPPTEARRATVEVG